MAAYAEAIGEAGAAAPWLVLVHGATQDARVFDAQVAAFRGSWRLLLVDLPGHGRAAAAPGPFGQAEYAAAVRAALDAAGVDRCVFWGTHTGAAVGLLLAAAAPARFAALALEGVVLPGHPMPSVEAALARARAIARTEGLDAARRQWLEEADWFAVMRRRPQACRWAAHRAIVEGFAGAPWLDRQAPAPVAPADDAIAALTMPVLAYNGAHDLPDFHAAADRLQALLPAVTRATVPDAGGFPAWEFPDRVNRLVAGFLARAPLAA